jgi:hypothetical protein
MVFMSGRLGRRKVQILPAKRDMVRAITAVNPI